ncbi:unnamed protein product [Fusarium fujikuroi]|uniref:Uncharacterized protein n=1 Tax=Fusarium fujikuroi TaxID=5127 RepID=A0A9Q9RX10_FUSFU|nr:unnamed protein product [Fusarium fujikuroi]
MFKCPHKSIISSHACYDKSYRIFAKNTEDLVHSQAPTNAVALFIRYSISFPRCKVNVIDVNLWISIWKLFKLDGVADGALLDCGNDTEV